MPDTKPSGEPDSAAPESSPSRQLAAEPTTRREIFGWCMYDVGDSAFTTVIVTVLYSLYFSKIVVGHDGRADFLWGLAASISEIAVALLAPVLGAIADFSGSRKKFLGAFAVTIVVFTAALWTVGPGMVALGLGLYIVANIAFTGGGVFIDSFLPGISTQENAGRISGLKWAMGYLGGLLALVVCLPLAASIKTDPSPEELSRARLAPLVVAVFYMVAVIPTFLFLKERSVKRTLPAGENYVSLGFRRLGQTFRNIRRYGDLFKLLLAFLVYNDGIVTVITFAAKYAEQTIGFSTREIVVMFILMNVIALAGALSFGWLADKIGQKRTILISLGIWIAAVVLAYFSHSKESFYVVAALAGIGMGSCQSVTRSLVALFTPKENAAEFAGFLAFAGKAVAFLGPITFGTLSLRLGSQRPAILAVGFFFVAGALLLLLVNEERGKAASRIPVDANGTSTA